MSYGDIPEGLLMRCRLRNLERLAAALGIDAHQPFWFSPCEVAQYKRTLCNLIARRTDSRFFRR